MTKGAGVMPAETTRGYDPEAHGVGQVHLGLGAFHRAHQADYTDAALAAKGGDWRITGVSLRSRETVDALNAQNGRYTLVIRDGARPIYRRIGSIAGGLTGAEGEAPILEALARVETKIISLTITEKAYQSDAPAMTLLTKGLFHRFQRGAPPVTLMSCDNLSDNGEVLRQAVLVSAERMGPKFLTWVEEALCFPSTMVDRITPASDSALLQEVRRETGIEDRAAIQTEAFSQWVIEDSFAAGRPDWDVAWDNVGALLVQDVRPYEKMKLRMLNGAHSMLAYAGFLAGCDMVRDVMAVPALAALVKRHMQAAAATLDPLPGVDFGSYTSSLLARFQNPAIAHQTAQIAMDGSQKLPQRIFEPALTALDRGQSLAPFAFATAMWIRYLTGRDEAGVAYTIHDPRIVALSRAATKGSAQDRVSAVFSLDGLVPQRLLSDQRFTIYATEVLEHALSNGVFSVLDAEIQKISPSIA